MLSVLKATGTLALDPDVSDNMIKISVAAFLLLAPSLCYAGCESGHWVQQTLADTGLRRNHDVPVATPAVMIPSGVA